ncbi:MAG: alpha-amylase family glycosyl hydrolase [Candidatus Marinimicrobia bacterium]|nr:alpha-amylase family glycosyl hydrolase [Candidatus Neomarinimicrobiota bacterium]
MMKHPPGCHRISGRTYFTLYAPYAQQVRLLLFGHCSDDNANQVLPMRAISGGYWEYSDIRSFTGNYYAFQIDEQPLTIADPYARSISTFNDFRQHAKAYIHENEFDWEGDSFISPADPRDMIIYECHIRDMTAHPSAKVKAPGTYAGFAEKITYLKELGVNTVEFLPIQHFANYEPPYAEATDYVLNSWNPYAYNHWGYMTAYFFAPVNFYSTAGKRKKGTWSDPRGREIDELKALIKELHKAGISVIMDVVYNHISQYNLNPLRVLAEDHYIDSNANTSGCGNDICSDSPVVRKLITDSIRYWMEEFHIDGFRFDLAGVLDDDTLTAVRTTARSIYSNAILIGEPWGKRYFPHRMSDLGLGVWNDLFRNGMKGENPYDRKGFIFGHWDHHLHRNNFTKLLTGSWRNDGGHAPDSRYSVNYLASHDGYTLGDFIRIATRKKKKTVLPDHNEHIALQSDENELHRLAAFLLATSQGIMMMHAGQEFARSKVIMKISGVHDPKTGELDHDSYAKDNKTNYINYEDKKVNEALFTYYRDLIAVRKAFPELRSADHKQITPLHAEGSDFALGYLSSSASRTCAVLANTSPRHTAVFKLDEDNWDVHIDRDHASCDAIKILPGGKIELKPRSHYLLVRKNT